MATLVQRAFKAVKSSNCQELDAILKQPGSDINRRKPARNDCTLLHIAVFDSSISEDVVKTLLAHGADPKIKNKWNEDVVAAAQAALKKMEAGSKARAVTERKLQIVQAHLK